jgi:hypothetical protein
LVVTAKFDLNSAVNEVEQCSEHTAVQAHSQTCCSSHAMLVITYASKFELQSLSCAGTHKAHDLSEQLRCCGGTVFPLWPRLMGHLLTEMLCRIVSHVVLSHARSEWMNE